MIGSRQNPESPRGRILVSGQRLANLRHYRCQFRSTASSRSPVAVGAAQTAAQHVLATGEPTTAR